MKHTELELDNLEHHTFLTSSPEIDTLIQPLKDFFGLTSFVYQKNFVDGSEIRLSNQPHWVKYYYESALYQKSLFEHQPQHYNKTQILWASLPQHQPVLSKAREFNIDHGITFIEPQADGCEFFFLGTTPQNSQITQLYFNHKDLLERFLIYFKERAAPLIKKADKSRLSFPNKAITAPAPDIIFEINRNEFLKSISSDLQKSRFSPRELECIALLMRGFTFKMIAYELKLSYRTIETHFEHIKQKTGCYTKAELVRYLSEAPSP